jgi:hypothetical protein
MHGLHVEIEREVPVLLGAVEHAAMMHISGAVDEHVERAKLGCNVAGEGLDRRSRAHVELVALEGFDTFEFLVFQIGGDQARALGCKSFGNGTADPLSRRGDERELAL